MNETVNHIDFNQFDPNLLRYIARFADDAAAKDAAASRKPYKRLTIYNKLRAASYAWCHALDHDKRCRSRLAHRVSYLCPNRLLSLRDFVLLRRINSSLLERRFTIPEIQNHFLDPNPDIHKSLSTEAQHELRLSLTTVQKLKLTSLQEVADWLSQNRGRHNLVALKIWDLRATKPPLATRLKNWAAAAKNSSQLSNVRGDDLLWYEICDSKGMPKKTVNCMAPQRPDCARSIFIKIALKGTRTVKKYENVVTTALKHWRFNAELLADLLDKSQRYWLEVFRTHYTFWNEERAEIANYVKKRSVGRALLREAYLHDDVKAIECLEPWVQDGVIRSIYAGAANPTLPAKLLLHGDLSRNQRSNLQDRIRRREDQQDISESPKPMKRKRSPIIYDSTYIPSPESPTEQQDYGDTPPHSDPEKSEGESSDNSWGRPPTKYPDWYQG